MCNRSLSLHCTIRTQILERCFLYQSHQPGNEIDIYLKPLVDELKELWEEGVETYDEVQKSILNFLRSKGYDDALTYGGGSTSS